MSTIKVDTITDEAGTGAPTLSHGVTVAGNLSVDGGTIKLDGNYPIGSQNVALGGDTFTAIDAGANYNTALGYRALEALTTGDQNTAVGRQALADVTTGSDNTAVGFNAADSTTSGGSNVAVGRDALQANTTASNNTAVGYQSLYSNTTGTGLVAVGANALDANTTASNNVGIGLNAAGGTTTGAGNIAIGTNSLLQNTTGGSNVSIGTYALNANTTASNNVAVGYQAGYNNTAEEITAVGTAALFSNTTGLQNVAVGRGALYANTTGSYNAGFGRQALASNTTATYNTALGYQAGYSNSTGNSNVFVGQASGYNTTSTQNVFVGQQAGYYVTSGQKNTILGRFDGNQGGLDIRTSSNNIVLSDGDGDPRAYYHGGLTSPLWIFDTPTQSQNSVHIKNSATVNPYGIASQFTGTSPNNTTQYFYVAYDAPAGSTKFVVYANGNVANINNSYGAISDVKLKENIIDSGSQWDDIKALRVRKYSMKADNLDAPNQLGVIAQELENAGMNGLVFETPDQDFDTKEDLGTITKQVNYSILYMKAVKALQEAMDRIETLEAKVTALENA